MINLDEFKSIETQWIALYLNDNSIVYFDSFGVKHILKEMEMFIGNKKYNKYTIQTFSSIMCGYFCVGFIDFMLNSKSLLDYANLVCANEYKKNDRITLKYFQ